MNDDFVNAAKIQPLSREVVDKRIYGARVRQHAPHLLFQHDRFGQLSALGEIEQALVGNAAPQKEREPRGDFEIAQSIGRRPAGWFAGTRAAGSPDRPGFARARTGSPRRNFRRHVGRRSKKAQQRVDVGFRDRTPIGKPRHPRQDSRRAGAFAPAAACGLADEDRAAARRVLAGPVDW